MYPAYTRVRYTPCPALRYRILQCYSYSWPLSNATNNMDVRVFGSALDVPVWTLVAIIDDTEELSS